MKSSPEGAFDSIGDVMPQSLAYVPVHFVFSTKNREPIIQVAWQQRLYDYIGGICTPRKCKLLGAGGIADHVHLLITLARDISMAELVRDVKAVSSGWVHEELQIPRFQWQAGYGAFAVNKSLEPSVLDYIRTQQSHHAAISFQDEYRKMLRTHEIEFDERYVWD